MSASSGHPVTTGVDLAKDRDRTVYSVVGLMPDIRVLFASEDPVEAQAFAESLLEGADGRMVSVHTVPFRSGGVSHETKAEVQRGLAFLLYYLLGMPESDKYDYDMGRLEEPAVYVPPDLVRVADTLLENYEIRKKVR